MRRDRARPRGPTLQPENLDIAANVSCMAACARHLSDSEHAGIARPSQVMLPLSSAVISGQPVAVHIERNPAFSLRMPDVIIRDRTPSGPIVFATLE